MTRDFFHGWRRKIGVRTLVMASTFLIGRFRSDTYSGTFSFPFGKNIRGALNSENGYLFFEREYVPTDMPPYPPYWRTLLCCDPTTVYLYYRDSSVGWRFQCFAFGEHKCKIIELTDGEERSSTLGPVLQTTWFLSYWSVIAPLTLISAYLLLSQRPKSKSGPAHIENRTIERSITNP